MPLKNEWRQDLSIYPSLCLECLNCKTAVSELRWLTFTSCCFIAYYCALLSSGSRFKQLQSSQGTCRGWATRSWWGYWWGTYRKPHIIHTHQPQHVTPNEASAAFQRLIAQSHCLWPSLGPVWILQAKLSSNRSWQVGQVQGFRIFTLPDYPQDQQQLQNETWLSTLLEKIMAT